MEYQPILIAIGLFLLGVSFAYKCYQAMFMGKVYYWSGLTPVGLGLLGWLINPFFIAVTALSSLLIHLPPGKNSLIKTAQGWWIHMSAGPIFLVCSIVCMASGADQLGMPGSETLGWLISGGPMAKPGAKRLVTYSRSEGYKFPGLKDAGEAIGNALFAKASLREDQKLVPGQ